MKPTNHLMQAMANGRPDEARHWHKHENDTF